MSSNPNGLSYNDCLDSCGSTSAQVAAPSVEWRDDNNAGPDYDPHYFDKLEALFEKELGPLGTDLVGCSKYGL